MKIADRFTPFQDVRRILIVQLGDIGDVVWSTPTFRSVKEYFGSPVSVLVRQGSGALLAGDSAVQAVFEVPAPSPDFVQEARLQISLIRALREQKFDLVFDLRSDDRGAIMTFLTGAPRRASLYYGRVSFWRNRLFTHLAIPDSPTERRRGAAEQSLRIVRAFGIPTPNEIPRLWVAEESRLHVDRLLEKQGIASRRVWVTLNPFSRWSYKEWDLHKWSEVIDRLGEEFQVATVLVGSKSERERAQQLCGERTDVHNLAGMTTLAQLAALLQRSRLHIGVDSAAPHIAAAVGTPTVTIYGPTDWYDWAPIGENHRVVVSPLPCVPCFRKGCDGQGKSRCLDDLTVGEVMETIRAALREAVLPPQ
jgi:heptosyltransferase-3